MCKSLHSIAIGRKITVICSENKVSIFWDGNKSAGILDLNVFINTAGLWTDSSKANWEILEEGVKCLRVKVTFHELPLTQFWIIRLRNDFQVDWRIDMEVEEYLHIDEFRFCGCVSPKYESWMDDFNQDSFPNFDNSWHDLYLGTKPVCFIGTRFFKEDRALPSIILEPKNEKSFLPFVQNTPRDLGNRIIGFRKKGLEAEYSPGNYCLFESQVSLFANGYLFDNKLEGLRKNFTAENKKYKKSKKTLKVILTNLPWQNQGKWGVRAGSRWPHIRDVDEGGYLPFPFFLGYATSLLRKNGVDADLIDALAEKIPGNKFVENLSHKNFDILVAEISTPSFYHDMELLKNISSLGIRIVLCGSHPEIYEEKFLKENKFIDFVLFGEYELTLLELIKAVSQNKKDFRFINGLVWRDDKNGVVKNLPRSLFDINILPWPYRKDFLMEKYLDLPGGIPYPSIQMVASRGCPFGCNFCLWPQIFFGGNGYRTRHVKDCIDEMEFLVRNNNFKSVYFDDDTFNIGKQRMLEFCSEIDKRGLNEIPWAIMAKSDLMDEEILNKMRKSGLAAIKYGVESASQELLNKCDKNLDLKKTENIIRYTKALGIKVHLTFSFGLAGETKETIKKTIDYALKLDPYSVQFSIITPFPGTSLFEYLDKKGKILTKDWSLYDGYSNCVFQPDNVSPWDLEKAKRYAYKLWAEHQRRKRGFWGDIKRFFVTAKIKV